MPIFYCVNRRWLVWLWMGLAVAGAIAGRDSLVFVYWPLILGGDFLVRVYALFPTHLVTLHGRRLAVIPLGEATIERRPFWSTVLYRAGKVKRRESLHLPAPLLAQVHDAIQRGPTDTEISGFSGAAVTRPTRHQKYLTAAALVAAVLLVEVVVYEQVLVGTLLMIALLATTWKAERLFIIVDSETAWIYSSRSGAVSVPVDQLRVQGSTAKWGTTRITTTHPDYPELLVNEYYFADFLKALQRNPAI